MDKDIAIAVLAGTTRDGRESIKAAKYVAEFGRKQPGVEIIFIDPAELNLPHDGDQIHDPHYTETTKRADAFFIVTPEYNHGYPGSLKRMLDSEYDNYFHKAVITAGVSSGPWGGARVCEAILPVVHRLGLVPILPEVYFPKVQDLFDDQGNLKAEHQQQYAKNLQRAYDELIWMARVLKRGRETNNK